nr:MAG TPA: hypothetical protein [Caudoviricetes sp.]
MIKVLTYRHTEGEGYAVSGESHESGNDDRGREILFKPV